MPTTKHPTKESSIVNQKTMNSNKKRVSIENNKIIPSYFF